MKWAIISDIHSNLEALLAVLDDIREQDVSRILCLGDIVGYNANPAECVEIIRRLECPALLGNHDQIAPSDADLGSSNYNPLAQLGLYHSRSRLNVEQRRWLAGLPMTFNNECFTAVHASLAAPGKWPYVYDERDADAHFEKQKTAVSFCGHTHEPQIFYKKRRSKHSERFVRLPSKTHLEPGFNYLVNVGSVGQPRDYIPKACYGIFDTQEERALQSLSDKRWA